MPRNGPLNTTQLNRYMRRTHGTHFLGVRALNQLPKRLKKMAQLCFIMNSDPSDLPGKHWLAVYIDTAKRTAEVFDSYGQLPPNRLQHWFAMQNLRWTFNRQFMQGPLSTLCGFYCLFFLHMKCVLKLDMHTILRMFSVLALENDDFIRTFSSFILL